MKKTLLCICKIVTICSMFLIFTACSKLDSGTLYSESNNNTTIYDSDRLIAMPYNNSGGVIMLPSNYKVYGEYMVGEDLEDIPYYSDYEKLLTVEEVVKKIKKKNGYIFEIKVLNEKDIFQISVYAKSAIDFDKYYDLRDSYKYTSMSGGKAYLRLKGEDPDISDSPDSSDAEIAFELKDKTKVLGISYVGDKIKSKDVAPYEFLRQVVANTKY